MINSTRKVNDLVRELSKIQGILRDLDVVDDVMERQVKAFGNGGHVIVPKEHLNKKVRLIVG